MEVCVTSGLMQAEIIKGRLEANGIPVLLQYESLGPVMGLTIDGLGQVQVLVRADQADTARALLECVADLPIPTLILLLLIKNQCLKTGQVSIADVSNMMNYTK